MTIWMIRPSSANTWLLLDSEVQVLITAGEILDEDPEELVEISRKTMTTKEWAAVEEFDGW